MDSKTAQLKAKNKLQFWTFILFSILVIGAGFEYISLTQPLDEVMVIYMPQKSQTAGAPQKAEPAPEPKAAVEPKQAEPEVKETAPEVKAEPKAEETKPAVDAHPHAAQELLGYMNEVKQKVESVTFSETALDKIKQNPAKPEQPAVTQQPFEENKIEIYDEKKGVVEVIETPAAVAPVQEKVEQKAEDAAQQIEAAEQQTAETIEKAKEEVASLVSEADAIAQQVLDNQQVQEEQKAEEQATQAMQELMDSVGVSNDEEQPIVLIPALQQNQN